MPQKRQAARPDAVAKPHVHTERLDTYPSAPTDPRERLAWMRRRNAAIAGVDEATYLEALAAQDGRATQHLDEQRPKKS
jgi:hypothetical protein